MNPTYRSQGLPNGNRASIFSPEPAHSVSGYETSTESSEPAGIDPNPYYAWLGKRYLESTLAEVTVWKISNSEVAVDPDIQLAHEIYTFRYSFCFGILQQSEIAIPQILVQAYSSNITKLRFAIGHILYNGSQESRQMLSNIVQTCGRTATAFPNHRINTSASLFEVPHENHGTRQEEELADDTTVEGQDPGIYTSALHKWCSQQNYPRPQYDFSNLSREPYRFQVTVTVNGRTHKAHGGSQKDAKHKASRGMCEVLRISAN